MKDSGGAQLGDCVAPRGIDQAPRSTPLEDRLVWRGQGAAPPAVHPAMMTGRPGSAGTVDGNTRSWPLQQHGHLRVAGLFPCCLALPLSKHPKSKRTVTSPQESQNVTDTILYLVEAVPYSSRFREKCRDLAALLVSTTV